MAFSAVSPASTRCRAKSTIMIPFFFTMPISMNIPTNAYSDACSPKMYNVSNPPTSAVGSVESTVSGWT